jgi:glycosyltransferase involved in cell wall biosynthesis
MQTLAVIVFVIIVVIDIVHYGALVLFLRGIAKPAWRKPEKPFTPKTVVCLALRGADPFIKRCITGLLTQDYPNYSVRLLVDSKDDSALPVVQKILDEMPNRSCEAEIQTVEEHFESCTLKCNSLVHALETFDPSVEVLAVCDADTNPHPAWLQCLVEPLSEPEIAAATGHRWYIPDVPNTGSLVRYLWNAAAVVQLYLYRIAWGGSMALRRDLFDSVRKDWKTAFTDDASLDTALKKTGCRLVFVPSLFMVNRETVTLPTFHRWVKRQLLCAKLHHPAWNNVAAQGLLITLPLFAAAGLFIAGLRYENTPTILWSLAAVAVYWLGVYCTLPLMERTVRQHLQRRGESVKRWSVGRTLLTLFAIPITQIVYTSALLRLYFLHRVEWRGIEYEITGKNIRLIEYKPYTKCQKENESVI